MSWIPAICFSEAVQADVGFASGSFFWGYMLTQLPGAMLIQNVLLGNQSSPGESMRRIANFLEIGGTHFPFSIKQSANESKIVYHLFLGMLTDPRMLEGAF